MESGQDIELIGKSGERYSGKIYGDKNSSSSLTGRAIACLSNSSYNDNGWIHQVNAIYNTENITEELARFKNRDDISHLVLLPYHSSQSTVTDRVDDLIRSYVHR
jgi:hypothetical protein